MNRLRQIQEGFYKVVLLNLIKGMKRGISHRSHFSYLMDPKFCRQLLFSANKLLHYYPVGQVQNSVEIALSLKVSEILAKYPKV